MAKTTATFSTHDGLQSIEACKATTASAGHAIGEYLATLASEIAGLNAEAADIERQAAEQIAEHEARVRAETKEEADRLRAAWAAKDARVKDIQSRFSFVVGTISERTTVSQ